MLRKSPRQWLPPATAAASSRRFATAAPLLPHRHELETLLARVRTSPFWKTSAFIAGKWVDSSKHFAVHDPATGELLSNVADMGVKETDAAITASHHAFHGWRRTPPETKSRLLMMWHDMMLKHKETLAAIVTLENGKPQREALGEVDYAASFLKLFAEEATRIRGEILTHPTLNGSRRMMVMKQPVGVASLITPWNFPLAMVTRKVAPALAAGCTTVLKPASETPLSALALAEMAAQIGLPPGVFNVVPTSSANVAAVGDLLTTSPLVRKISFTGSTGVGKLIMRNAAQSIKRVSLELGGNAAFIVFADADLDAAVQGVMASKFRNSGQTCVSANRIFVQRDVHDEFVRLLAHAISKKLVVGSGVVREVNQGPLISSKAVDKVERLVRDAVSQGATVLVGDANPLSSSFTLSSAPSSSSSSSASTSNSRAGGCFWRPTLLTNVTDSMRIASEEIFGPIATVLPFDTEEEVVARANLVQQLTDPALVGANASGLAGYFFTKDISRAFRVAEQLECGIVGVNEGMPSTASSPFGGWRQSGVGVEGSHLGIEEYLEVKYVCLGGQF